MQTLCNSVRCTAHCSHGIQWAAGSAAGCTGSASRLLPVGCSPPLCPAPDECRVTSGEISSSTLAIRCGLPLENMPLAMPRWSRYRESTIRKHAPNAPEVPTQGARGSGCGEWWANAPQQLGRSFRRSCRSDLRQRYRHLATYKHVCLYLSRHLHVRTDMSRGASIASSTDMCNDRCIRVRNGQVHGHV